MNQEILDQLPHDPSVRQEDLINDTSIFYKGLFGLILCIFPGAIIGLVLIKISLEQAKVAMTSYQEDSGRFRIESYKKVKSGRTMAYIGLVIFICEILALVGYTSS
ncbi:MAG: hypothetical protein V4604_00595 [Bacteroidota bacterium]